MALAFDPAASRLLVDGIVIAPDPQLDDIAAAFPAARIARGSGALRIVTVVGTVLAFTLNFDGDTLQSGYLWLPATGSGGWDEAAPIETRRREAHRALLADVLGAEGWHDERIVVTMMFDAKTGMEIVAFHPPRRHPPVTRRA